MLSDQSLVHAAKPTAIGRVDGGPQSDGLTIHRATRRNDQIRERDEALGIDRVIRHDDGREAAGERTYSALGVRARQHHGLRRLRRCPTWASTCGNSGFDLRW